MDVNPYASPRQPIESSRNVVNWRTIAFARSQLMVALGIAVVFWLFVPLFMLFNVGVFFAEAKSRPLWATGTLAAALGIGMVLLWVVTWMVQAARREYREAMQAVARRAETI
jgi:Na+/melibiose symporter-like transporter